MSEHPEPRSRDDTDAVRDIARDLADIAAQISTFKGEAQRGPLGSLRSALTGAGELHTPKKSSEQAEGGLGEHSRDRGEGEVEG